MTKKIEAIIFGVGSLFNVWGNQMSSRNANTAKDPCKADMDAVGSDFAMVGADIRKVIGK
jgi:hypothetical protein